MKRQTLSILLIASVCLYDTALLGQEQQRRQSVTLPADAKAIFLAQMLGHVVSLDGIVTALGQGDYAAAAQIADAELGVARFQKASSKETKSDGPDLGIGSHLPDEFRAISLRFREVSTEFAALARNMPRKPSSEQHQSLMLALSKMTNRCRICHDSYRVE